MPPKEQRDATRRLPTEGYSNTMERVFAWEAGKKPLLTRRKVGSSLSTDAPRGPRENQLYAPLHFMGYTVGYLSIWNCVDLMHIKCVSAIVNTLTMALRSYFAGGT